jgi:hypothetical protein
VRRFGTTVAALLLAAACSLGHSSSTAAIGDSCLAGSWTLVLEKNSSAYALRGVSLAVQGLEGATLVIKSDGAETESFAESKPLVGTTESGQTLAITVRGTVMFHIHADGHAYAETGSKVNLPTTATLDGTPVQYDSWDEPGHGTYSCSAHSLTTTTAGEVQTDSWSRP